MSYLVLARKWRPKTFDDLVGQEPIVMILKNAVSQGKISHAYIFSGPRGVGKTSSARILAKALNCKEGPTPSPCGVCASCTAITEGSSVDVIEIDGASNNSVDDIRDLRERVKYAPSGGKYKVYIIDEVHMLSSSAFNALLKTLEEPPSHVIFVLATTEMRKIPATVLSRCQHMPFRRVPAGVIKARLRLISEAEGIRISPHALGLVARAADGSMRDSLTILDQISSFTDEITEEHVQNLLGIADFGLLAGIARALLKGDRPGIISTVNILSEQGADFRSFTKELAQFFRDLLVASVVRDPGDMLDLNDEETATVRELVTASSDDQLALILAEIMKAEADVRNTSLPRMALEMALIRTSFLSTLKPVREVIARLDGFGKQMSALPSYADPASGRELPAASPAATAHKEPEPGEENLSEEAATEQTTSEPVIDKGDEEVSVGAEIDIRDIWKEILERIDPPLASKLAHTVVELQGDELLIILNGGQAVFRETIAKSLGDIEKAVSEHAGRTIRIKLETQQKRPVRKKDLKEKAKNEPVVREALELFEGRIVDVIPIENENNTARGGDNV